jgi:starvation-inducible DNA-binding protein
MRTINFAFLSKTHKTLTQYRDKETFMAQQKVQTMDRQVQTIDIGIDANMRKAIVEKLGRILADSYTLYLKTHNFHWNVTGPMFRDLHLLFEEQYTELASAVDEIAERIRTLGAPSPGTYREFQRLTQIKEPEGVPPAVEMIAELTADHETVSRAIREALPVVQEADDDSTDSLLADRLAVHEKTAWMLRTLLQ